MKRSAVRSILIAVVLLAVAVIAEAQQPKKVPRIGYLAPLDPDSESTRSEAIRLLMFCICAYDHLRFSLHTSAPKCQPLGWPCHSSAADAQRRICRIFYRRIGDSLRKRCGNPCSSPFRLEIALAMMGNTVSCDHLGFLAITNSYQDHRRKT